MTRIKMGRLSDLPPGGVIEKRIMARRVAVFNHEGQLYGLESDCKHMRASLANGDVSGGIVKCKWHGWRYELETGNCLDLTGARLKRYDVDVVDGEVFIEMR